MGNSLRLIGLLLALAVTGCGADDGNGGTGGTGNSGGTGGTAGTGGAAGTGGTGGVVQREPMVFYRVGSVGLFKVPLDGSTEAIPLSPPLVAGGDVLGFFIVSPDGGRVVYRADQDTDEVFELYASKLDGTGNVRLNVPLPAGLDVENDFVAHLVTP